MFDLHKAMCLRCDYEWEPWVESPAQCPRCNSSYWDRRRKKAKKRLTVDRNNPEKARVRFKPLSTLLGN